MASVALNQCEELHMSDKPCGASHGWEQVEAEEGGVSYEIVLLSRKATPGVATEADSAMTPETTKAPTPPAAKE